VCGATTAGLLQLNTGRHSITPCLALGVSDECSRTAHLLVIKVRSHHATPTPTSLADGLLADRIQAVRSCLCIAMTVFTAWHRNISRMDFIIRQSRSFEGICVPLRLMSCLFPVPDSQPMANELLQSPPFGSGTVVTYAPSLPIFCTRLKTCFFELCYS